MIEVELPGGGIAEFPDGTPQDVMLRAVKAHLGKAGGYKQPVGPLGATFDRVTDMAAQGATFGLADEVGAAGGAIGAWLKRLGAGQVGADDLGKAVGLASGQSELNRLYTERLDAKRSDMRRFTDEHPVASTAMQVAGGLASGVPAAAQTAATVAPTFLRTFGQGVTNAATQGAAGGAGSAEGGTGERLLGAATGAAAGAAVGAALPLAAGAVEKSAGTIANMFGLRNADKAAVNQILRAFERDGVSLPDAINRLEAWRADGGKPAALFDLAGENLKGLARAAAGTPGEAKNAALTMLAERQAGQAERVSGDVAKAISPSKDYRGGLDALMARRRVDAEPLYEKALAQPIVWSPRLQQFLDDPVMRRGLKEGVTIQRLEALAEGKPFDPKSYAITGFNEAGDPIISGVPNMRTLNVAKKGIDNILEGYRDPTSGRLALDETGRAINDVRKSFLRELDDLNDDYKAARQAWGGPTQSMDAMALGRNIFTKEGALTQRQVAALSPGDKEFFRAGVTEAIRDIADKTRDGADITKRIFGSKDIRDKLRAAFDTETEFAVFQRRIKQEAELYANAQVVSPRSGPGTAQRLAEQQDMAIDPSVGALADLVRSRTFTGATMSMVERLYRRAQGMNSETADALAKYLFNVDAAANRANLEKLLDRRTLAEASAVRSAIRMRGLDGRVGAVAGVLTN